MNKSDLIAVLAKAAGISHGKSSETITLIFEEMTETLSNGGRIEIRGFGSFVNRHYNSYIGRNPKSKELISVPSKRLPYFKVGKELKARISKGSKPGA